MPNTPDHTGDRFFNTKTRTLQPREDGDDSDPTPLHEIQGRALPLSEILSIRLAAEIELLGRMLLAGTLGLLYGMRGGGKSLLAMIISYAVAGAKAVDPWGVGSGAVVCYLDGEMRIQGFQERLAQLHASNNKDEESKASALQNLWVVSRHLLGDLVGTLDTVEGQQAIEAFFPPGLRLLVIDNLSAWTSNGGEDINGWQAVKSWLIHLRLRGIAVILIHHAGKGGAQRGTSAHEDLMDYSIEVSPEFAEDEPEATAFRVVHKKLRDQLPHLKSPQSFRIRTIDGAMRFSSTPVILDSQKQLEAILELQATGKKGNAIAKELGLSEATVSRRLKEHREVVPADPA